MADLAPVCAVRGRTSQKSRAMADLAPVCVVHGGGNWNGVKPVLALKGIGMRASAYVCATVCLATVYMIGVGLVEAKSCVGLDKVKESDVKGVITSIVAAIRRDAADRAVCGSLASVVDKVIRRGKIGGRQLEADRPLDMKQAQ